ncbi:hypothetical protein [Actinoplanes sp. NPDC051411]|uniref:hypothetical protein n=1 Tax=Actinoplanes sp. NPDC051411 TaxID=3155522 RepID=UPI003416C549
MAVERLESGSLPTGRLGSPASEALRLSLAARAGLGANGLNLLSVPSSAVAFELGPNGLKPSSAVLFELAPKLSAPVLDLNASKPSSVLGEAGLSESELSVFGVRGPKALKPSSGDLSDVSDLSVSRG